MSGREGAAPSTGAGTGSMNLFVHLTPADLTADAAGACSIEKLGAATTALLADWLARWAATGGKVTMRPVIDLEPSETAPRTPSTSTTRPRRSASSACCATPTASSPAAASTPGAATSTTSPPTSRWETVGHRADQRPQSCAVVQKSPPAQDAHRLGLQAARRRHLHLDRTHRPPVHRPTRLPPATTAEKLTPRTPAPAQPGTSARARHSPPGEQCPCAAPASVT